uniref:C-type lectin domain-containing protein n=1 Tax=Scophthalmus maximus TaxID=52904 RepID=A0A8D3A2G1_SCOMX
MGSFYFLCVSVLFFSLSPSELRCSGPDWYEFGEFCYKPFGDRKTWHAHEDCVARGANLVSIHSQEEEEFLSVYSKASSKWIAHLDPNEDHSDILGYSWSDGTPLSHTNWGRGEPNDHDGREECVEMVSSTNGTYSWWNDLNCDAHQDWISANPLSVHKSIAAITTTRHIAYSFS